MSLNIKRKWKSHLKSQALQFFFNENIPITEESHIVKLPTEMVYNVLGHPFLSRLKTWRREANETVTLCLAETPKDADWTVPVPTSHGDSSGPSPRRSGRE